MIKNKNGKTSNELKSFNAKGDLTNIKSRYIIISILFDFIPKFLSFKVINYNKQIQNRIDISILDFQEYVENFPQ